LRLDGIAQRQCHLITGLEQLRGAADWTWSGPGRSVIFPIWQGTVSRTSPKTACQDPQSRLVLT
jgi:hypothetical protein